VEVIIPRVLADRAVSAWQRTDSAAQPGSDFHYEAATLALIGQSIEARGVEDGGQVIYKLDAWICRSGPPRRISAPDHLIHV